MTGVEIDQSGAPKTLRTLVVYDSLYGNTEKVAQALAGAVNAEAKAIGDVDPRDLSTDLLVVGSPTQGGRPTPATQAFLEAIPPDGLQGMRAAHFDTRIVARERSLPLRILMGLMGYASPRIAGGLTRRGARLVGEPQGFYVEDKAGPLKRVRSNGQSVGRRVLPTPRQTLPRTTAPTRGYRHSDGRFFDSATRS
jgi:hypothetical protein